MSSARRINDPASESHPAIGNQVDSVARVCPRLCGTAS